MALFSYIYLFLVITVWKFGSVVHAGVYVATSENFVRPSNFENKTCQFNPCLPLNDYAREADHYFKDNTIFTFLPGTHELDVLLDLRSLSNITLIANSRTNVSLVFNPLVNMTWTNCINIQISDLNIVISGREIFPDTYIFATLVFNNTVGSLSRLTFCGNKNMSSTAVLMNESNFKITNLSVIGARSLQGAALHADSSTVDISGQNTFIDNHATDEGGAIAIHDNSTCNMTGSISFINNTAKKGGAMAFDGGNHHIYGDVLFISNFAAVEGGALILRGDQYGISGKVYFMYNSAKIYGGALSVPDRDTSITLDDVAFISNYATQYGGAINLSKGEHSVTGNILFVNNSAGVYGGAITAFTGSHKITGNISFENNMSEKNGGAVAFIDICHMSGTILFVNNQALIFGGAAFLSGGSTFINNSSHTMSGNILFADNSATTGGAIYSNSSHAGPCKIFGNISFVNNTASYLYSESGYDVFGGAIAVYSSDIELVGNVSFQENIADSGGAIYMDSGVVIISGIQNFVQNEAEQGGALAFSGTSKLILSKPLTVDFIENEAKNYGGALFVIDSYYDYQCSTDNITVTQFYHWPECFIELSDYNADDIHLNFINNTAEKTGKILYGGSIDRCKLYKGGGIFDNCGNRQGGYYDYGLLPKFQTITNTASVDKNIPDISSDPLEVCFCDENDTVPNKCEDPKIEVIRGREFTLKAITLGQNRGSIPSDVRIIISNGIKINEMQHVQSTTNECSPITFRLFSAKNSTNVVLFPADSPCRDTGRSHREIKVSFIPCPDAFYLEKDECICDERLHKYTTNCSVDDNSIIRSSKMFWMGVDYYNNSTMFKGLILHNGCPFDYCVEPDMQDQLSITLDNLDIQCNHNHAGTLCGCCKENYSVVFGTIHCLPCSNAYLALILPFAFAGIALIMVLILLKLSIANGTLNALIFYANIIQANRSIFFPLSETNPLTIFIAWLNLDLGAETCFYDGMTVYGFTWLQFVFPFYIWFLIGLIIIVTHYSQRATNMLGTNPVAVLATLLLLSYSKLLRTVIMALSVTHLEYPGHTYDEVWLYDGSVPYFRRADHIVLGIFAILVLLLLFVPYTLLLLCGHVLQAYSQRKPFSWIDKLKPFLDAYHAPYKKETRYWTGFLLVVRCILLVVFGLNAFGNANDNLLAITTFTACLLALISLHKGIYKTTYNNILETFFILNLCIFSATTYHVQGNQAGIAYSFVGVAFSIFLLIVLLHVYLALSKTSLGKRLPSLCENFVAQHLLGVEVNHLKQDEQRPERDHDVAIGRQGEQRNLANQAPTTSFIDIREYEPLLDSK